MDQSFLNDRLFTDFSEKKEGYDVSLRADY